MKTIKNQQINKVVRISLLLLFSVFILSSCGRQEKRMKEFMKCRDACYQQGDQVREQWKQAREECRQQFDADLDSCRALKDNADFKKCIDEANKKRKQCEDDAENAYEEGMKEIKDCVDKCWDEFMKRI